jgi:hypothetical protein
MGGPPLDPILFGQLRLSAVGRKDNNGRVLASGSLVKVARPSERPSAIDEPGSHRPHAPDGAPTVGETVGVARIGRRVMLEGSVAT